MFVHVDNVQLVCVWCPGHMACADLHHFTCSVSTIAYHKLQGNATNMHCMFTARRTMFNMSTVRFDAAHNMKHIICAPSNTHQPTVPSDGVQQYELGVKPIMVSCAPIVGPVTP